MNERTREALRRLASNSDWRHVVDSVLTNARDTAVAVAMREQDPPAIYRLQGEYRALDRLIRNIEQAGEEKRPAAARRSIL